MISILNNKKGFTLIELLVVISIISLLSSIIFASISNARDRARDTAIISAAKQMEVLMNLEYNETKSYGNLQTVNATGGWITASTGATSSCAANFAGNYATKARDLCNSIVANTSASSKLYADTSTNDDQKFSIMAPLSTGLFICIGTSGRSTTETGANNPTAWDDLGCYANP